MLTVILFLAYLLQGGTATFDCNKCIWSKALGDKTCVKTKWWDPCLGCKALTSTIGGSKLGGFGGGFCPSLSATSLAMPSYLPMLSASTSQVPVFKSYFKPIFKAHYSKIPFFHKNVNSILAKLPCLNKKFCLPTVGAMPLTKFSCLKSSCLAPKFLQPNCCSPFSTFC